MREVLADTRPQGVHAFGPVGAGACEQLRNSGASDRHAPGDVATLPGVIRRLAPLVLAAAIVACGGSSTPAADDAPIATDVPAGTASPADPGTPASTAPAATGAPATNAPDPAGDPAAVPEALQFTAPLVGGGEIDVASLAGRPVLLWFWAPF